MRSRCSVFVAASVDGFIARPDGDVSWLERPEYAAAGGGLSYDEFIADVDAVVMGRRTFEKVLTFGGWPYGGTPVVVLSSRGVSLPDRLRQRASVESGSPVEIVRRLAQRGVHHLYVDGGVTIQRFLRARRIDEMIITWIPVLLGEGIPLFGSVGLELPLELVDSTGGEGGVVQTRYRVKAR